MACAHPNSGADTEIASAFHIAAVAPFIDRIMHSNLFDLLPSTKMETEKAETIVALGYPCVEPILPELIEWMKDCNWPVAQVLQPFLASVGAPLAPHIREVLISDDDIWKYWVVSCIVSESSELASLLTSELQCLALSPTVGEHEQGVDEQARAILERILK